MSNRIENDSIDLTITSPPYNVDLGNGTYKTTWKYDTHDDNMDYDVWLEWLAKRWELLFLKTKKGGRFCLNIGNQKNGRIPVVRDMINIMEEIGWKVYTQIIWNKNQCSPRTAWGSFQSPSSPSFPTPFEFILVFCKDEFKLQHKGRSDLTKKEFIDFSLSLWTMAPAKKTQTKHPSSFPEELSYRCMKMFSYIDDLIYDPFAGVGTTLLVANSLSRRSIGSEISEGYCKTYYDKAGAKTRM